MIPVLMNAHFWDFLQQGIVEVHHFLFALYIKNHRQVIACKLKQNTIQLHY